MRWRVFFVIPILLCTFMLYFLKIYKKYIDYFTNEVRFDGEEKGEQMNSVPEILDELQSRAQHDAGVREKLLLTKSQPEPLTAFCRVCRELGYEIYPMELIAAGEEFHAQMKRSTNGGGENSPMLEGEDDFYEMFFAAIERRADR